MTARFDELEILKGKRGYDAADRMIMDVNRISLAEFGKLRGMDLSDLRSVMTIGRVYKYLLKVVRKRAYEVGYESYLLGLAACGISGREAYQMAEHAINDEWADMIVHETDLVTLYRFDSETERKAGRLIEALAAIGTIRADTGYVTSPTAEIDRALKAWSRQVGQFAIWVTDSAVRKAYLNAGVKKVAWVTRQDERVCQECGGLDGKVFPIDEVPPKPHWGCRCWLRPVLE